MSTWKLQVQGMTCSSCARNIENTLYKEEGVKKVSVNVILGSVLVQGNCKKEQLVKDIEAIGFNVTCCVPVSNGSSSVETGEEKVIVSANIKEGIQDNRRKLAQVRTGVEDILEQVPTIQLKLRWKHKQAAESCAQLLKNLQFVKQVCITSADRQNSAGGVWHYLNRIKSWTQQFTRKEVSSSFLVTADIYDFRSFYPNVSNREEFKSWEIFLKEMGTNNIRAALYAYLSCHLSQFSWETDCQVDVSITDDKVMESVMNTLRCVDEEGKKWKYRFLLCAMFSVPLLCIVLVNPSSFLVLQLILATLVQCYGGYPFYRAAFQILKHSMRANMAVLITTSTSIAYFYSLILCFQRWFVEKTTETTSFMPMFETSAMLITVVVFGKWMESILKMRASYDLEQIGELLPSKVNLVLSKGAFEEDISDFSNCALLSVDSSIIEPGDILQVLSGCTIPVDGKIVCGTSFVDESFLTGEPCTVHKSVNDIVYAGAVNLSHTLYIHATSVGGKTSLEEVMRLWNETLLSKAPTVQIVDKVSAIFVPTILLLSLGVFLCWWLCLQYSIVPMSWWENEGKVLFCLYFGLSSMVIACPCALGLAAPIAYMIASFVALRHGVVYRDLSTLIASIEEVRNIVFDKTGTLTIGKPVVTQCHSLTSCHLFQENDDPSIIWSLVEELESHCVHPIAKALVEYAHQRIGSHNQLERRLDSVQEQTGMGMQATFQYDEQWHSICIGQKDWILTQGLEMSTLDQSPPALKEALIRLEQLNSIVENETLLLIAIDHIPIYLLLIEDAIRPEARQTIQWLEQTLGVQCWLLSGDNYQSARHVANLVGIHERHVVAKLQPWQKWQWIQTKIEQQNTIPTNHKASRIVFVGDGLNDAPALARADIGIAMGNANPLSHQTAAVVLKRNDLRDVITALDLTKKLKKTIYWNYMWAMIYNLLAFPPSAGLLYPWWRIRIPPFLAAAAMGLSSISVMLSSLRLKNYHSPVESLSSKANDTELQTIEEYEIAHHLMA